MNCRDFERLWLTMLVCRHLNLSAGFHTHAISTELRDLCGFGYKSFPSVISFPFGLV